MFDTAIISDRIIMPDGIKRAIVLIKDGIIADIVGELPVGNFPVIDLGNKVLMPGVVDPHVHINEPGRTNWEGFETATKGCYCRRYHHFGGYAIELLTRDNNCRGI